jgi:hypothetical protein
MYKQKCKKNKKNQQKENLNIEKQTTTWPAYDQLACLLSYLFSASLRSISLFVVSKTMIHLNTLTN